MVGDSVLGSHRLSCLLELPIDSPARRGLSVRFIKCCTRVGLALYVNGPGLDPQHSNKNKNAMCVELTEQVEIPSLSQSESLLHTNKIGCLSYF